MVRSTIQECERTDINIFVELMPNKDKFRQMSQNRYYRQMRRNIFCNYCQLFQTGIHLCRETNYWYNIDFTNLLFIRAKTRSEAERQSHLLNNSGQRAQVFPTRSKMMMMLYEEADEQGTKSKGRTRRIGCENMVE